MEGAGFVGRESELSLLGDVLQPAARRPVVFVHGPAGIGKSALLTELARRARRLGMVVRAVDGREPALAQEEIEAIESSDQGEGELLLVDTYEEAAALGPLLREGLGAAVARGARIVLAGRRPPEPAWLEGEWEHLVLELPLAPLSDGDARALLEGRGIEGDAVEGIADWGQGHPLSLAVAADSVVTGSVVDIEGLGTDELLASTLVRRLARDELDGADHDVLAVAAIARAVDARLLGAVIPEVDGDRAENWLRSLSFAEPLGTRVTLHARMRAALATAVSVQDPAHDRELRRRIADHLYQRIVLGEVRLIVDLAEMVADPDLRWGIAPVGMGHSVTRPRPGDRERIGELLGATGKRWWEEGTRRWFEEAPEHVSVVRDAGGEIAAWGITTSPASAPEWAESDPVIGPWLADAREAQPDGDVFMLRDAGELPPPTEPSMVSEAISAGNYYTILGSGLPSLRRLYVTVGNDTEEARRFIQAVGYEPAPHLDAHEPDRDLACFVVDHGPGGLLRAHRDMVYATLGLTPPALSEDRQGSAGAPPAGTARDALRSFHDPLALANSPLARGTTTAERAESVRARLRSATIAAFGDSDDQRLLRATIERGYLDPEGGHARAMHELHVSRTTYFRRLAEASERVATYLSAEPGATS